VHRGIQVLKIFQNPARTRPDLRPDPEVIMLSELSLISRPIIVMKKGQIVFTNLTYPEPSLINLNYPYPTLTILTQPELS
jgi:hypothetical protein